MKTIYTLVAGLVMAFVSSHASVAAVEKMPAQVQYGGKTIVLNGVGVRKKFFMSMYLAGLYLTAKSKDADAIMKADEPMSIRLAITSSLISPAKMKSATLQGFQVGTGGNIAPIKAEIDQMLNSFDKGVGPGDVYELTNVPGSGVHVIRNGKLVETIRSAAFKQALFGIWLSNTPVHTGLRAQLLGG